MELDDEHHGGARDAQRARTSDGRVQAAVPRGVRRLPVGDGRLRRPGAAGHDLPRAPRRAVDARPADLRVRRAVRLGARAGGRAARASAGRSRTCWSSSPRGSSCRRSSTPTAAASTRTTPTWSCATSTSPASASSWAGAARTATSRIKGEPNPKQWEMYAKNNCVLPLPAARAHALHAQLEPRLPRLRAWTWRSGRRTTRCSWRCTATCCSSSGSPRRARPGAASRRSTCASASRRYFDPLPFWYAPLEDEATDRSAYPLNAVTQRPMAMYHSWDSQNAWLRQIHSHNYLFVNPRTARAAGVADGGWVWVESQWGKVRCMVRYSEAIEPGTVWTWNAIGKGKGAWKLAPGRRRVAQGLPAQPPDQRGAAVRRRQRSGRSATPIRSPARPAGTTCACACGPPRRGEAERDLAAGPRRCGAAGRCCKACATWCASLLEGNPDGRNLRQAARARHRPQRLRRLPRLRDQLQGVEHLGLRRAAGRTRTPTAPIPPARSSTGCRPGRPATYPDTQTVHFPKSCLHCEDPPCVPVCPTGASYKRKEDGIVLVDYDKCIGCKYCAWACPYGVRELDESRQVMTKCTLCVDRIYDPKLAPERPQAGLRQGLPDQRAAVRRHQGSRRRRCRWRSASAAATR